MTHKALTLLKGLTTSAGKGRATPANDPAPAGMPAPEIARTARVVQAYARLRNLTVSAADLQDAMARASETGRCAAALAEAGLKGRSGKARALEEVPFPALLQMRDGTLHLGLELHEDGIDIFDHTRPDQTCRWTLDEVLEQWAGSFVSAERPVESLADAHIAARGRHWFWGAFRQFTRPFAEVALGSFIASMLAVSVALFSLQVYDRVIPHQSEPTLWVLAIGAGLALMMEAIIKMARARLLDGAGRQIETGVQGLLMDRLLGMRSDLQGRSPSQLFAAMRDFSSVREFFTATTVGALADLPFIFLFLLLVWSIAGNVVWVLIAGGVLMVLPGLLLQGRMMRLTREMQGASVKSARLLQETVTDLDTIKATRGEDRFRRIWAELTALQAFKSSDQRRLSANLTFWSQGVQQATYVAAVIAGTYMVFAGQMTVGSIIAVGILTSRTLAPLTQLAGILSRWSNVKTALEGLDGVADAPQDTDRARSYLRRDRLRGELEVADAAYCYDPDMPAAVEVKKLAIAAGEKVAVLGVNGSGKSTLLKMLSGLYAPQAGRIMVDGTEMGQIAPRDLRRRIGYLGQDVRLFSGTLRDNLCPDLLGVDDARAFAALDFAGLGQFVKSHPKGLDLEIRDGGEGLSVGQRQSVGWARLWLQDPDIVLLDEPTAALDQTLEKTLISRLETWLDRRTAVIATHRVPILSLASRTLILQNGRLAVDGPRDMVLDQLAQARKTAQGVGA